MEEGNQLRGTPERKRNTLKCVVCTDKKKSSFCGNKSEERARDLKKPMRKEKKKEGEKKGGREVWVEKKEQRHGRNSTSPSPAGEEKKKGPGDEEEMVFEGGREGRKKK